MAGSLCYGDVIALRGPNGGLLEADGLRDARPWLTTPTATSEGSDLQGCLFEIAPMQQYAARRELMLLAPRAPHASVIGASDDAIRTLRSRAAAEAAQNAQKVAEWAGRPVMCGHIVQLRHTRSGRFLSVSARVPSSTEPSCTLVELTEAGSICCWLQLEPASEEQVRAQTPRQSDAQRPRGSEGQRAVPRCARGATRGPGEALAWLAGEAFAPTCADERARSPMPHAGVASAATRRFDDAALRSHPAGVESLERAAP